MIKLYNKQNILVGRAIKWNGTNKIEFRQFGVTGGLEERQTKIDCQGTAFVRNDVAFEKVKKGNFVVQHGSNYKQMDVYTLMELYEFNEQEI